MKNFKLLICVFLLCSLMAKADSLPYNNCSSASNHLVEVNPEWAKHLYDLSPTLNYTINFESEADRIKFHFEMVIQYLEKSPTENNSTAAKLNRQKLLTQLYDYGQKKVFPINKEYKERRPCFVDHRNTHCAVGHMLRCSDEKDLIQEIKSKQNYAYVQEFQFPELNNWANNNGFTKNELALIQPAYPGKQFVWDTWGDGNGIDGKVNIMRANTDGSLLILAGSFNSVDGVTSNNIVAYDGEDWSTLGAGVDGEINDIEIDDNNQIFIVGDFSINGNKVNVAVWDGNSWEALASNANGTLYALKIHNNKLFVGGAFSLINNITTSNLAYYDFNTAQWSTNSYDGHEGVFSTDGVVRKLEISSSDSLVVAGSFNETGILSNAPLINRDSCYNISFWKGNDWEHKITDAIIPDVHTMHINTTLNIIHIGGDMSQDTNLISIYFDPSNAIGVVDVLNGGNNQYYTYNQDSLYQGYVDINGTLFIYGSIEPSIIGGTIRHNLLPIAGAGIWSDLGINYMDGTINAVTEFKNQYYFAGTFTHLEGIEMNGLARTDGSVPVVEIPELDLTIASSFRQLSIAGELDEKGKIALISNTGQVVFTKQLAAGVTDLSIPLNNMPSGVYYYHFSSQGILQSDKIVVVN